MISAATRCLSVALAISAAACAPRSAPTATPASPVLAPRDQLRAELDAIFKAPPLDHASWGVRVDSLATGETLYRYNDFKLLLPASNQKLISSAVAAARLGWDYRFTTRLLATGRIDDSGTLQGDLVVTSNGDPTINPRHGERARVFEQWAEALWRRGLRAINGRIIGDDNAIDEPGLGEGWTWENLSYGFGTAIGALQFNENQVVITITPAAPGGRPIIATQPETHDMVIVNEATTGAPASRSTIDIARLPGSPLLRVIGQVPADVKPVNITASVNNPTQFYLNAFKAALMAQGVAVSGEAVDVDDLGEDERLDGAEWLRDTSPPLREVIDVCLKWSRNDYAETLLRAIAPAAPATPTAALEVMRSQLATWGLPALAVVPLDGSGLSRQDYTTAHGLNLLLTYIWMEPELAETFRSTLPVAGVSGTLAHRMKATPLEARVWAKTGTLNSVRSLSGYLLTSTGEALAFSMLVNNFQVPATEIDEAMERALLRILGSRR